MVTELIGSVVALIIVVSSVNNVQYLWVGISLFGLFFSPLWPTNLVIAQNFIGLRCFSILFHSLSLVCRRKQTHRSCVEFFGVWFECW